MATEGETQSMNLDSSSLSDIILDQEREANVPIENIRSKVSLTRDAARAISITAFETLREGAKFMGVMGQRGGLKSPFGHIDASIWKEGELPENMIEASYEYCEELTRIEAANFYHSFKYLPNDVRRSICAYYAFCRGQMTLLTGITLTFFPEALKIATNRLTTGRR